MYQKLPYYMAYPIQTEYDERNEFENDLEFVILVAESFYA